MKVRLDDSGNLLEISKTMDAKTADGEFLGIAKFTRGTVLEIQNAAINLFAGGKVNQYMEAVIQEFIEAKTYNISTFDIGDSPFVEIDFESDYSHAKDVFGNSDVLQ